VADMGSTPSGPVVAEDIRDLKRRARQRAGGSGRRRYRHGEMLERAGDLAERLEGDAGVERGGVDPPGR